MIHAVHPTSGGPPSVLYRVNGATGAIERRLPLSRDPSSFLDSTTANGRRLP